MLSLPFDCMSMADNGMISFVMTNVDNSQWCSQCCTSIVCRAGVYRLSVELARKM